MTNKITEHHEVSVRQSIGYLFSFLLSVCFIFISILISHHIIGDWSFWISFSLSTGLAWFIFSKFGHARGTLAVGMITIGLSIYIGLHGEKVFVPKKSGSQYVTSSSGGGIYGYYGNEIITNGQMEIHNQFLQGQGLSREEARRALDSFITKSP